MAMTAPNLTTAAQIAAQTGLTAGTTVLTLAGAMPVEFLNAGDRIITRDGVCTLTAVTAHVAATIAMVRVCASAIGIEQPEEDMLVTANTEILIRDWRAKALKGADQAIMRADKLIDGEYIRAETSAAQRLFTLSFDRAVVIYAGGLELAISPVTVAV